MNGIEEKRIQLFDRYVLLEKQIQQLMDPLSRPYCRRCTAVCCREEMCRESIESAFLSVLVQMQKIRYNRQNGWLGNAGCRLAYGRPLVCYEFFCEDILHSESFQNAPVRHIVREFVSLGNRVYGNAHLICISDLDILSVRKMDKLLNKINVMLKTISTTRLGVMNG